jgi:TPR repeat protein
MYFSPRRFVHLRKFCFIACLSILAWLQGNNALGSEGNPEPSKSQCDNTLPLIPSVGSDYDFVPPQVGRRFYQTEGNFIQITKADGRVVQAVNHGFATSYWVDGVVLMQGEFQAGVSPIKSLWPLHEGGKQQFKETWPPDTWFHFTEVGKQDFVPFDGRQVPVVWIEDKIVPAKSTTDADAVFVSEAFAPAYGFPLVRNVRRQSGAPQPGQSFAFTRSAYCSPMPAELNDDAIKSLRENVKKGDHQAELDLAMFLADGPPRFRDPTTATALLERAAQAGLVDAQVRLGVMYLEPPSGNPRPDSALPWLQKAAEHQRWDAATYLATLYMSGQGVPADLPKGMALLNAAAEHDDAQADLLLGVFYLYGRNVPANPATGVAWLRKAADRGVGVAMMQLGAAYRDGIGVKADRIAAYAWMDAALGSLPNAALVQNVTTALDNLSILLLPDEIKTAQALSRHWRPGADFAALTPKSAAPAIAQTPGGPASADKTTANATVSLSDSQHPIIQRLLTWDFDVSPDASKVMVVHSETEARNSSALHLAAQIPLRYSQGLETLEIVEAFTQKPDGRKIPVDVFSIYEQLVPGAPDVPMFDDQRQKVIVFPDVEVGDIMSYTAKFHEGPLLPGLFSFRYIFPRSLRQDDVRITIRAPKTMPLTTEEHSVTGSRRDEGDKTVYEWRYSNPNPIDEDLLGLDPIDRLPRVFVSSFSDYDQFGHAYEAFVESKRAVTPKLAATADEITRDISDRRKQAEALYYWVSHHIRYVGVELAAGGFVPHDAEVVLANGYGDCKDHAILFSALLAAKQIDSEEVLINYGKSYALARPPTFGNLNHVITWLPEFGMYVDTTAGVAQFGDLPFEEYGKPVVHAVATGPTMHRIPVLPPDTASVRMTTHAKLDKNGAIKGTTEISASGAFSVRLRQLATIVQSQNANELAARALRSTGYEGSGHFDPVAPFDVSREFRVSGQFDLNQTPQLLSGTSFYLPLGLNLGTLPGDELMGSFNLLRLNKDEPTPCFSGKETLDLSLELPKNVHLREIPAKKLFKTDTLTFQSEWFFKDHVVSVHREFRSTIDAPICVGKTRDEAWDALKKIRSDYSTAISLVSN